MPDNNCTGLAQLVYGGQIIDVANFTIAPGATASSLRMYIGIYCLQQSARRISDYIVQGKLLPVSEHCWGQLYKQSELEGWMLTVRENKPDHHCLK